MNVDIHGAPIYFEIPVLGGIPITSSLLVTWAVMLILTLLCIWLTHDLKVRNISKRQAVAEYIVGMAENLVRNNMGEQWMRYVPFISTIFALSVFSSLSSLVCLFPPTADLPTVLAWAVVAFVII
ncbi:MAG: F0F1 ATP synthase subunit A, partial [Clostridia bacterium]|nr:F0F1 ATP synthase subunit A [Clostridia bacterium]